MEFSVLDLEDDENDLYDYTSGLPSLRVEYGSQILITKIIGNIIFIVLKIINIILNLKL